MPHTFLSLDVTQLTERTMNEQPKIRTMLFSNDGTRDTNGDWLIFPTRMLVDGYNFIRHLVHIQKELDEWFEFEPDPRQTQTNIFTSDIEYTYEEYIAETKDVNSIWYRPPAGDI